MPSPAVCGVHKEDPFARVISLLVQFMLNLWGAMKLDLGKTERVPRVQNYGISTWATGH